MKAQTKHEEIFQELRAELMAGKYASDTRLPSEAQLVRRFGVSRPTVARALCDLQHAGLVKRRAGAGTFACNATVTVNTGAELIGLLAPGIGVTEVLDNICGELASLARGQDYTLLLSRPAPTEEQPKNLSKLAESICRPLLMRKVRGVFFAPFEGLPGQEQTNLSIAEHLRHAGIAVILLDRDLLPFPQRSNFDLVSLDNFSAGYVLTSHLIKLGCRKIQFVARVLSAPSVAWRYAGFREALLQHDLPVEQGAYKPVDPKSAHAVRAFLKPHAEALVCANDITAAELLYTLESIGRRVPQDIRVGGFDDVKYATLLRPPLTTIHQPCSDLAAAAWRAMLDRINNPTAPARHIQLVGQLVVRDSCGVYLPRR